MLTLFAIKNYAQTNIVSGKISTVVIDAGHGGRDPGAIGKVAKEKEITLALALKLGKLINQRFPEITVIYTRQEDKFIELYQRADIANKAQADLFISIHVNSNTKRDANGVEFWVLGLHKADENLEVAKKENSALQFEQNIRTNYGFDPNSPEGNIIMTMKQSLYLDKSIQLAKTMETKFTVDENQVVRGTKQAGFVVLYKTAMPSVLVEVGFISNPDEEQYMVNDYGQIKIATKLANAFAEYKRNYESGTVGSKETKPQTSNIESNSMSSASSLESNNSNSKIKLDDEPVAEVVKKTEPFQVESSTLTMNNSTKKSSSLNSPNSSVLDGGANKKRIVIDDEIDREVPSEKINTTNSLSTTNPRKSIDINTEVSESKTKANSQPPRPTTKEKISLANPPSDKKMGVVTSSNVEAKSLSSEPKMVKEKDVKLEKKSTIKENIIAKSINAINSKEVKPLPAQNSTSQKEMVIEEVPSYINDASIKNEIIDNAKEIDKSYKSIEQSNSASNQSQLAKVNALSHIQGVVFKIQVKASSTKAKLTDKIFTIGEEIEESLEDGLYKYLVGNFKEEVGARDYQDQIKNKGIIDAFVVKYSNGLRVK